MPTLKLDNDFGNQWEINSEEKDIIINILHRLVDILNQEVVSDDGQYVITPTQKDKMVADELSEMLKEIE